MGPRARKPPLNPGSDSPQKLAQNDTREISLGVEESASFYGGLMPREGRRAPEEALLLIRGVFVVLGDPLPVPASAHVARTLLGAGFSRVFPGTASLLCPWRDCPRDGSTRRALPGAGFGRTRRSREFPRALPPCARLAPRADGLPESARRGRRPVTRPRSLCRGDSSGDMTGGEPALHTDATRRRCHQRARVCTKIPPRCTPYYAG